MLHRIRLWLRTVFLRGRLDREMREEMDAHLTRATDRLIARGIPREEARRAARREFGHVESLQEEARDARGARWVESLIADVRFGLRHFGRTPYSTATMIVLLALGIGLNSALFTVIYSVVNMPPPGIERDESLVRIRGLDHNAGGGRTIGREFAYPEYREYAAQKNLFSAVTAWTSADVVLAVSTDQESLRSGAATYVTSNYFQVLGVRLAQGVGLPTASDSDDAAPELVAVISYLVWDRLFGKAPDVIGKTVQVNDVTVTIVGVAPRRFATRTGGSQMRVWLPLNARPLIQRTSALILSSYDSASFGLAARLHPGIETSQTIPTVQAIAARSAQQTGRSGRAISTDVVTLLADNYFPPSGEAASALSRATTLLIPLLSLLIPCTNVSALLVGLAYARRREIVVRLSLGAARKRIFRQLLTESVLLAFTAGALGLLTIWVLLQLFDARLTDTQMVLHWPVFAFTFGIAIATGILFGVSPALHATRVSVAEVLKDAANAVVSARSRLQSGLVITQIAITMPLLLGGGALILELFSDLQRLPAPTFTDRIMRLSFNSNPRYSALDADREGILRQLQERIATLPGVISVVPQASQDEFVQVSVHPSDRVAGIEYQEQFWVGARGAPPGFFELMGFPLVRGRDFDRADQDDGRALVIRGDLARRLWGSADPIGRRLVQTQSGAPFVVVGIVDETIAGPSGEGDREQPVFVPNLSGTTGSLLVRTQGPAQPLIPLVRSVANTEAAAIPITSATTLAAIEASQRSSFTRAISAAAAVGAVALFLCAIGLYAVVSFAVGQRTREIGIRTAMGADPLQIVRMFFFRGLRLSVFGSLIGLTLSAIVVRVISLSQGNDTDPRIFGIGAAIAVAVVAVAALATWIPARRAARVDPLTMLRTE